ncbi:MAG: cation transporter [Oscillospiraceae bacterium]|jgi:copper ion binding protein|nr:cation transporter [Oscillospiraceae bacterium]
MKITKKLYVEGMSCSHCAKSVADAVGAIPGVKKVDVNLNKGLATVKLESEIADTVFGAAITDAGFTLKQVA